MSTKQTNREWNHPLFSCTEDLGLCITACCCPWWVHASNKAAIGDKRSFCYNATLYCVCIFFSNSPRLSGELRREIRKELGIKPNRIPYCGDCLTHFFCSPCAMTQESLELRDAKKEAEPEGQPAMVIQPVKATSMTTERF